VKNYQKLKVVFDTNVWLSGLIFGGKPGQLIKSFGDDAFLIFISEELLSELRRKITQKFPLYIPTLNLLEMSLRKDTELVKLGSQTVTICRDPDDNKVIETALIGDCQYVVSGDKDLLELESYKNIKIMNPAQFLEILSIG